MRVIRYGAAIMAGVLIFAVPAIAQTVVKITLIDKMGVNSTHAPALGMDGDMSKATMGVNANPKVVRQGSVTFKVTNLAS